MVTIKHGGLNVAADAFMASAHGGVGGGFVLGSADDPSMHSSQNEQGNRLGTTCDRTLQTKKSFFFLFFEIFQQYLSKRYNRAKKKHVLTYWMLNPTQ
jgi:hypothetical protein